MSCVCLINNGYPHLSFLNKHPINRLSVSVAVLLTSGPEHQNEAMLGDICLINVIRMNLNKISLRKLDFSPLLVLIFHHLLLC